MLIAPAFPRAQTTRHCVALPLALSTILLACAPIHETRTESRVVLQGMESKKPAPEHDHFRTSCTFVGDHLEIQIARQSMCRIRERRELNVTRETSRTPDPGILGLEIAAAVAGGAMFAWAYDGYRDEEAAQEATGDNESALLYEPYMVLGTIMLVVGATAASADISQAQFNTKTNTYSEAPIERVAPCAEPASLQGQHLVLVGGEARVTARMDAAGRAKVPVASLAGFTAGTRLDIVLGQRVIGQVTIPPERK